MPPPLEDRILTELLSLSSGQARLSQKIDLLHATLANHVADDEKRITAVEQGQTVQAGWRSRLVGASVGVTFVLALLASVLTLWAKVSGK